MSIALNAGIAGYTIYFSLDETAVLYVENDSNMAVILKYFIIISMLYIVYINEES
jgi:hypothetical protein